MFCSSYFYIEIRTETDTTQKHALFICREYLSVSIESKWHMNYGCVEFYFPSNFHIWHVWWKENFIVRSLLTKSEIVNNCVQKSLSERKPFFLPFLHTLTRSNAQSQSPPRVHKRIARNNGNSNETMRDEYNARGRKSKYAAKTNN